MRVTPKKIYFMGIAGTGMASAAGLAKLLGHEIWGSDQAIYPPMSTLLKELNIPIFTGYSEKNLVTAKPDLVVIANSLSRGHPEIEYVLDQGIPYTSFPALLEDLVLKERFSIVVSGTHGKTTTSSLLAHVLRQLDESPSFLIGGIPKNFSRSFGLGEGQIFVIEGDEYDTAFFDKRPKFLHYSPDMLILNNLEYDHADIYPDLEAIKREFRCLVDLVPQKNNIIANFDDENVVDVLDKSGVLSQVRPVGIDTRDSMIDLTQYQIKEVFHQTRWSLQFRTNHWGELTINSQLTGIHNVYNVCQVLTAIEALLERHKLRNPPEKRDIIAAFESFEGVRRRMDHLGSVNNIELFEDFAHHPTAVARVIESMKKNHPERRLLVAFEPKNATSRRNLFVDRYGEAFKGADFAYIGACPEDGRIPSEQRMDTRTLAAKIGNKARAFQSNEELKHAMFEDARPGDTLLFMSSGSFSGVQYDICDELQTKN